MISLYDVNYEEPELENLTVLIHWLFTLPKFLSKYKYLKSDFTPKFAR